MKSYRDYLSAKGISPMRIERTDKAPGNLVLHSWARPVERIPSKAA